MHSLDHERPNTERLHPQRTNSEPQPPSGPLASRPGLGSPHRDREPPANLCFFCSTNLPGVYAMSPKHPPFTHRPGWTGNVLCSQQCTVMVQHQKHDGVKPKQIDHQSPVFVRPRKIKRTHGRKMTTKKRFVHACCIHSHIVYSGPRWKRSPVDQ